MKVTTQHVKGRGHYGAVVVLVDGTPVGHISKAPARAVGRELRAAGTNSARQPWRAYHGSGRTIRLIGVYYPCDGGKDAAVNAVAQAHCDLQAKGLGPGVGP